MWPSRAFRLWEIHLLGLLSGELMATSGDLRVLDRNLRGADDRTRRLHRLTSIGQIFQDHPLVAHLSVLDNVTLALSYSSIAASRLRAAAIDRARTLLARLDLHSDMASPIPKRAVGGRAAARGHRPSAGQRTGLAAGR